jgi:hypothetical protein
MQTKLIYTTTEAADFLGLKPQEIRRLADIGALRPLRGFRKPLKFAWHEIAKWLEGGK